MPQNTHKIAESMSLADVVRDLSALQCFQPGGPNAAVIRRADANAIVCNDGAVCGAVTGRDTRASDARARTMSVREYRDLIDRMGCKYIGSGFYSQVFTSFSPDRVFKVCPSADGWPDYIQWAHSRGYMGNFAPMVYGIRHIGHGYVALVERLHPIDFEIAWDFKAKDFAPTRECQQMIEGRFPGWRAFYGELVARYGNRNLDLATRNIMLSMDRERLVFNDPVHVNGVSFAHEKPYVRYARCSSCPQT